MEKKDKPDLLIANNEPSNISTLNSILKSLYRTTVAVDGCSAIGLMKTSSPDMILLGMTLSDMTGLEVLSEIKRDAEIKMIPVIVTADIGNAEEEETSFYLGAVDYIAKPYNSSVLRARIRTHLQMAEYVRKIERYGSTDSLTSLPNRRSFDHRMVIEWSRALREQEPLSLLIIDIDTFKEYNDKYGHTQGDLLLRAVANVFQNSVRRAMDFVARWGGEEFALLLPNTEHAGALDVAEYIRDLIEKTPVPCPDGAITNITVSIGVTTETPNFDESIIDFINSADNAMYAAKKSGRNRVWSS